MYRNLRRFIARNRIIAGKVYDRLFPRRPAAVEPPAGTPVGSADLADQVVAISGSSRGLGLALARAFLEHGARVVMNGRDPRILDAAVADLDSVYPDRIEAIADDVGTLPGARRLVAAAWERWGRLDVLIANAGLPGPIDRPLWEVPPSQWQATLDANLTGPFLCMAEAARRAVATGQPLRLINVSSGIAGQGAPGLGPYAVTKTALEGLTTAVATDAPGDLITALSLRPRSVRSALTRAYFDGPEYDLLEDPQVVTDAFLWAATAPAGLVAGRHLHEPSVSVNPDAEALLGSPMSTGYPLGFEPETARETHGPGNAPLPGAYLHLLENPHGPGDAVRQDLAAAMRDVASYRYPDPGYRHLRRDIATHLGLREEHVVAGPGSTELLHRLVRLLCRPGDDVVVSRPTWSYFIAIALHFGVGLRQVPHRGDLASGDIEHDVEAMLAAVGPRTRLLYLVNPCNPTGSAVDPQALRAALERASEHLIVVIDEAYVDYARPESRLDLPTLVDTLPARVLGLRTFSKFEGLSGCRIGYAYGRPDTVALLARESLPFAIAAPSAHAARLALADAAHRTATFDRNDAERRWLGERLAELDIAFMPSQTSFVLFDSPMDQAELRAEVRREAGLVLPEVEPYLRNHGVLPLGTREHNEAVIRALSRR